MSGRTIQSSGGLRMAGWESLAPVKKRVQRSVNIEVMRFFGYFFFLIMIVVGMIVTVHFVEWPVEGEPFDPTKTIIYQTFGFNHTCTVIDFNPSKTICAILVMFSTVPLGVYTLLNHYRMEHEFIHGNIGPWLFKFNRIITPYQSISITYFYMIFVNSPYDPQSLILHYIPFMLFQIALTLNEIHQVEYLIARKDRLLPIPFYVKKSPRFLMRAYSLLLSAVTTFYTVFAWSFIFGKPIVDTSTNGGLIFSQVVMFSFTALSTVIPMVSSFFLMQEKYGPIVDIDIATVATKRVHEQEMADGEDPLALADTLRSSIDQAHASLRQARSSHHVGMKRSVMHLPMVQPGLSRPPKEGMHPVYPYENIAFQGGGAKGTIYMGAILALDELGILPYLKRFAGTSCGTFAALVLALGLDADQCKEELDKLDIAGFFDGGSALSRGYNFSHKLGIHPGRKVVEWLEQLLEKYTGDPNLTFKGLYYQFGTELCVAVSNISRQQSEYCHINTTPELPIKLAIRASMSLPFLWEPIEIDGDKYVDGGLFCNFPLKAFDGWFLSTRREDGFLQQALKNNPGITDENIKASQVLRATKEAYGASFVEPNMATIGFRVSSDSSPDQSKYSSQLSHLERRVSGGFGSDELEIDHVPLPDTKKARAYTKKKKSKQLTDTSKYEAAFVEALRWMCVFWTTMASPQNVHPHGILSAILMSKLKECPPHQNFSPGVFGLHSWEEVVDGIDLDKKGYVTRTDLAKFWDKCGVRNAYMKNREPKAIDSKTALAGQILQSMFNVFEENLLRDDHNTKRICALSTRYVDVLDLDLEQEDKEYLYELGRRETIEWVRKNAPAV